MRSLTVLPLLALLALPSVAEAQDRPFVFSLATSTGTAASTPQLRVDYELGLGDQAFHQQASNGPEQRVGLHATVGRFTFIGHVGVARETGSYQSSQQGEVLMSLLPRNGTSFALAAGGGVLHEAGGANVLLARVVAGREGTATRAYGNLLLQHPLTAGRDAVDVITSVGWAARVTPALSIGVEGIGEDVEGFWNPEEAEGGSRILIGPSIHLAVVARRRPHISSDRRHRQIFAGAPRSAGREHAGLRGADDIRHSFLTRARTFAHAARSAWRTNGASLTASPGRRRACRPETRAEMPPRVGPTNRA